MIVVDTSIWIALINRKPTPAVAKLKSIEDQSDILVADIVLLEVLQSARDERHAEALEARLRTFQLISTLTDAIAVAAARNYRTLRGLAFTIGKTRDLILATYCIAQGHQLLHDDRDFAPFKMHLGLRVL